MFERNVRVFQVPRPVMIEVLAGRARFTPGQLPDGAELLALNTFNIVYSLLAVRHPSFPADSTPRGSEPVPELTVITV